MSVDLDGVWAGLLAAMPKRGEDECERCWYCGVGLSSSHEHDHIFPQSVRKGSGPIAPCCRGCHDLKDRTPLGIWDIETIVRALVACPTQGHARLLMAKLLGITMNANMELDRAGAVRS